MKIKFFLLSILLIATNLKTAGQVTDTDSLTIEKALHAVMTNQPLIKQAEDEIKITEAKIHEQESYNMPVVSAEITDNLLGPIPKITFGTEEFKFYPTNNFDGKIKVGYQLYDFNRKEALLDVIKSYKLTAEEKVNLVKNELAFKTAQVYYSILFLEKQKQVKHDQINILKKHIEDVKKLVETGVAIDLDVLTTQVRVASAENQLIDIQNSLDKSKIALRALMGLKSDAALNLSGNFDQLFPKTDENNLLQTAYDSREEIKIAQLSQQSNQLQKKTAELSEVPTVNLIGSYGLKNGFIPNLDAYRGNWVLGAAVSIPIFNGNKKDALVESADAKIMVSNDNIESLKRKIRMEVEQSLVDLKSSEEKLKAIKLQIDQAEQALNKAQVQYDNGVIKNLDLLDAETSLTETKLIYASALYRVTLNGYSLKQAIGERIW